MTIAEFGLCVKRHWYVVVIIMLVAMGFSGIKMATAASDYSYTASATVNANSAISAVGGVAKNVVEEFSRNNPEFSIKSTLDDKNSIVTVAVTGESREECVQLASEAADRIVAGSNALFPNGAGSIEALFPFEAQAQSPVVSQNVQGGMKAIFRNLIVPIMGGMLVAACLIIAIYAIRRPIIRKEDIEQAFDVDAFGMKKVDHAAAERLLANIRFASEESDVRSICIVPLLDDQAAQTVSGLLCEALKAEGKTVSAFMPDDEAMVGSAYKVITCAPVQDSARTLYAAHAADAVVLVVRPWKDSMRVLADSIEELQLAKAHLAGCLLMRG